MPEGIQDAMMTTPRRRDYSMLAVKNFEDVVLLAKIIFEDMRSDETLNYEEVVDDLANRGTMNLRDAVDLKKVIKGFLEGSFQYINASDAVRLRALADRYVNTDFTTDEVIDLMNSQYQYSDLATELFRNHFNRMRAVKNSTNPSPTLTVLPKN